MEESNKILKEQIEKLPTPLKRFVIGSEWTKKLRDNVGDFNLEDWQKTLIENEVLIVLIGLEDYSNLPGNISEQTEIDLEIAEKIAEFVVKDILKPAADMVIKDEENKIEPSNSIGDSFEQIILNQAKAMQPARDSSWNPESIIQNKNSVPGNLPTENNGQPINNSQKEKPKLSVPNYSSSDPYREPLA